MATNDFIPFATGNNANVTSQADWIALPAVSSGFVSGKASSAQVNKALRQGTFVTSALAKFISNALNADVKDNGDSAGFVEQLTQAVSGRLIAVQVFKSSGTYVPTPGARKIYIRLWGGGGGGGSSVASSTSAGSGSSGGSGGVYGEAFIDVTGNLPVTVGAGGAGGTSNGYGQNGGESSVGSTVRVSGGNYGKSATTGNPADGAAGAGGSAGCRWIVQSSPTAASYPIGGLSSAFFGTGGSGSFGSSLSEITVAVGFSGQFPGGGGGGAGSYISSGGSYQNGGKGADGLVIIEEYA